MKKLTAGIFATLLAVVSADSAYAAIASQGYVDDQVGEVSQTVTTLSNTVSGHTTSIGEIEGTMDTYGDIVTHNVAEFATAAEGDLANTAVQPADITNVERTTNKTTTLSGTSTDTQYPSAKAVWDTIQAETSDIASTGDLSALTTRVTTAEGEIDTLQTDMATKQDKNMGSSAANSIVTTDGTGNITASATIAASKVSGLGSLATKSSVATADIASKAVTKEKLADDIVTSLGRADTALQQASLNGYLTKTAADTAYAAKTLEGQVGTVSKENMGTTTATTVVGGVKEAINAAKAAASAASTADGKAVAAQEAAEAAQGEVDALEETVSGQGTRLTTAEGEIDTIQGKISNMATSDAVEGLQTTVTNLQSTKQDKTDNTLTTTSKTVVGAINEVKATADKKQDKLTGTVGGSMQPVYLNNGTITAGTVLGSLATKSKVTNTEVDDGALAQSKINGLATALAAKLTTPPASEKGESGLYVLTYDGTDFQWEDIVRTVAD